MTRKSLIWWQPTPQTAVVVIVLYVVMMLIALWLGAYEPWFWGQGARGGQGIDFFCVPKAYLNVWNGTSAFDTWSAPAYGPYATWFVLHPAVAVWVGGYFSWLSPWVAYGAFVVVTLGLLAFSASLFAHYASGAWRKVLVFGALLASPISYLLLFGGNVHGLVICAASMLLVGLHELYIVEFNHSCEVGQSERRLVFGIPSTVKITSGLLLSFLSKPILILLVPALLLVSRSRRSTMTALGLYVLISVSFLLFPILNPEAIGIERLGELLLSPSVVKANLNIYVNQFRLTPEMRDNAMHWLHMVAQSNYLWDHLQVLSFPVFIRGVTEFVLPFQWIALLPVLFAPWLLFLRSEHERIRGLVWLVLLTLSTHFLGYAIAWEYQYSQLLLATAALLALSSLDAQESRWLRLVSLGALATLQLPSPYIFFASQGFDAWELATLRGFRLLPAVVLAVTSCWVVTKILLRARSVPNNA